MPVLVKGDPTLANSMRGHGSPYLRLHENDPVAWQQWNPRVMELAKQKNKMLFVSIGYFSCHWCHVMQRESFSNNSVAKLLNTHFIPVKVDRELDPALDAYLIEFVQRTRGTAGWPLNVIISSDGYPVIGITYLPRAQFTTLLQQMTLLWQKDADAVKQLAREASQQLSKEKKLVKSELKRGVETRLAIQFLQETLGFTDEMSGGFGDQSKFPMAPQLNALLNHYQRGRQQTVKAFLELTFDHMVTQSLRDHIGGGFFRYTTDPTWQTPHFEKMLYDNAQLALLYMRAAKLLKRPDYNGIARETLNFMLRELKTADGAFISSLSALDNQNVEGGYYLWSETRLRKLLTRQEFEVVHLLWGMENSSQFEAGFLPRHVLSPDSVAEKLGVTTSKIMEVTASAQWKLFEARQQRSIPRDDKQLAGWNGLALQALVAGAKLENGSKFKEAAQKLRDYIVETLWDGKTLLRAKKDNRQLSPGTLEDYVFAAQGLWKWYLLSGNQQDFQLVKRWVEIAWQQYYDNTGWHLSDRPLLPQKFGESVIKDAPLPSASATLLQLSLQLAEQDSDKVLRGKVSEALSIGHNLLMQSPFTYPSQIETLVSYFGSDNGD
ncbi:thioredoxin domain-containing protein [Kaarinaea lacus]